TWPEPSRARVDGSDGIDGVRLRSPLVIAVADDTREAERHSAGIARRRLQAVERDLDDLLRTHFHDVAVRRAAGELREAPRLPVEHGVGHAFEGLAEHDESSARGIARAEVDVRQLSGTPARAPLDREHDEVEREDRLDLAPARAAPASLVRRGERLRDHP